jgi:hypothetical protein
MCQATIWRAESTTGLLMASFRCSQSVILDTRQAIQEIHADLMHDDVALVIFFCSNQYDLDLLAQEINRLFAEIPVIGCTSAGGFGPQAYGQAVLSAVSFSRQDCTVACAYSDDLQRFEPKNAREMVASLMHDMESQAPGFQPTGCFALQLIDGLSYREELVTRLLQSSLGRIPLVGGSAGDDMHFRQSRVFCAGAFRSAVAVVLVHTTLPFQAFMTQHFEPTEERFVVTEADAPRRIVKELDGFPAAQAYARSLGVQVADLGARLFAEYPVVVAIGANHYVRSIQRVFDDGSLGFYCAIEEGVVLRVARSLDLLQSLSGMFTRVRAQVGKPALFIGCDCVLRKLEAERSGIAEQVQGLLAANHAIGFCTYGEQYQGVHINQTLTGIAIGRRPGEPDD